MFGHTDWGPAVAALVPTVPAVLAWVRGRRNARRLDETVAKVDQVHHEVKSPNGSTTAEAITELRVGVAAIAVGLGEVQSEQARVAEELASLKTSLPKGEP